MDTTLQQKLYITFPEFFESVKSEEKDSPHTPQYLFGIECEDGWYDLLYKLFFDLEQTMISQELKQLDPVEYPQIIQIKEKFGGLRFYVDSAIDEQYKLINKVEKQSYHICEKCGKKGKLRNIYDWYWTLCKSCLIKKLKRDIYIHHSYIHYLYWNYKRLPKIIRWKIRNNVLYHLTKYYQKCLNYLKKSLSGIQITS